MLDLPAQTVNAILNAEGLSANELALIYELPIELVILLLAQPANIQPA